MLRKDFIIRKDNARLYKSPPLTKIINKACKTRMDKIYEKNSIRML